jgi:hypothetical protein
MPDGKPAGIRCIQLTDDNRCKIFNEKERPAVCSSLMPSEEMCGGNAQEAMTYLTALEEATAPENISTDWK